MVKTTAAGMLGIGKAETGRRSRRHAARQGFGFLRVFTDRISLDRAGWSAHPSTQPFNSGSSAARRFTT
jgi:hypothetical protein